jgi:pimeloyl-ACP methyl ester carboxylesterase
MSMNHFLFRGYKVCYEEAGQGEPLVFLHNGGNDHRVWEHQFAHFATTRRVFALDHLGFGASDKPRLEYTLPLYADMIAQFVAELGPGPVDLVGHCMGGSMALAFTLQAPERVRSLVLCHVYTEQTLLAGPVGPTYLYYARHRRLRDLLGWWLDRTGLPRKQSTQILGSQFGDAPPHDPEFAEYIHRLYNRRGQMRTLHNVLSNAASFGALDELVRPLGMPPVYLFWGRSNQVLPVKSGEELCRRLQPERFEIFDGGGHLLMREQPDLINQRIESFLTQSATLRPVAAGSV